MQKQSHLFILELIRKIIRYAHKDICYMDTQNSVVYLIENVTS